MSKEFIFELDNALYNEETGEAVFKPKVKGELVRCGECKYFYADGGNCTIDMDWIFGLTENDYCSRAERGKCDV